MPTINEIVLFLHAENTLHEHSSSREVNILRPATISEASLGEFAFCGSTARNPQELLSQTHASLLIVDKDIRVDEDRLFEAGVQAVIYRDNARLDFLRVVEKFFAQSRPMGIHPTAVIDPEASIHPSVSIGPFAYIGKCEIDEGTIIYGHVYVYGGNVKIGKNVVIHAGTVIGVDGFGYARNENGELELFPSFGGVIIEDDVDIHSHVNVDRGTLGNTIIGQGTKIDKFCHIGHNAVVGKHSVITAHCVLGGRAQIGDYTWIGIGTCIRDGGIKIGSHSFVGMATVITKDVPDNMTVMGAPARSIEDYKKLLSSFRQMIEND